MINAYRGCFSDVPAKILGVDMIELEREVAFHQHIYIKTVVSG